MPALINDAYRTAMPIGLTACELAQRAHHQERLAELADSGDVQQMHEDLEQLYRSQLVAKLAQDRLSTLIADAPAER